MKRSFFGKHKTAQRSISSIEQRTGLSFGPLAALDPNEDTEGLVSELTDVRQIRFTGRWLAGMPLEITRQ